MGLGGSDGGGGDSGGGSPLAPAVFPLPPEYEAAKERKVAGVADLRNAVKTVRLPESKLQLAEGVTPQDCMEVQTCAQEIALRCPPATFGECS